MEHCGASRLLRAEWRIAATLAMPGSTLKKVTASNSRRRREKEVSPPRPLTLPPDERRIHEELRSETPRSAAPKTHAAFAISGPLAGLLASDDG